MKAPSIKTLTSALNLTREEAATIRALIRRELKTVDSTRFPFTAAWVRECYSMPRWEERVMQCIAEVMRCDAVESVGEGDSIYWPAYSIVNTGSTYTPSIAYSYAKQSFRIACLGDLLGD
jgi:hypothetical protein